MFCTQVAREAGANAVPVTVLPGVESPTEIGTLLVAATGRIPLNHLRSGNSAADRLAETQEHIPTWPLAFWHRGLGTLSDALIAARGPGVLIVDDVDLWSEKPLQAVEDVTRWAKGEGRTALVSLPSHLVAREGRSGSSGPGSARSSSSSSCSSTVGTG